MSTKNPRQNPYRKRKEARGLKKLELWIYPECEPAIRETAKKIIDTWELENVKRRNA
jgi:hypothetical protein